MSAADMEAAEKRLAESRRRHEEDSPHVFDVVDIAYPRLVSSV
jgi:hypothetical protein